MQQVKVLQRLQAHVLAVEQLAHDRLQQRHRPVRLQRHRHRPRGLGGGRGSLAAAAAAPVRGVGVAVPVLHKPQVGVVARRRCAARDEEGNVVWVGARHDAREGALKVVVQEQVEQELDKVVLELPPRQQKADAKQRMHRRRVCHGVVHRLRRQRRRRRLCGDERATRQEAQSRARVHELLQPRQDALRAVQPARIGAPGTRKGPPQRGHQVPRGRRKRQLRAALHRRGQRVHARDGFGRAPVRGAEASGAPRALVPAVAAPTARSSVKSVRVSDVVLGDKAVGAHARALGDAARDAAVGAVRARPDARTTHGEVRFAQRAVDGDRVAVGACGQAARHRPRVVQVLVAVRAADRRALKRSVQHIDQWLIERGAGLHHERGYVRRLSVLGDEQLVHVLNGVHAPPAPSPLPADFEI